MVQHDLNMRTKVTMEHSLSSLRAITTSESKGICRFKINAQLTDLQDTLCILGNVRSGCQLQIAKTHKTFDVIWKSVWNCYPLMSVSVLLSMTPPIHPWFIHSFIQAHSVKTNLLLTVLTLFDREVADGGWLILLETHWQNLSLQRGWLPDQEHLHHGYRSIRYALSQ